MGRDRREEHMITTQCKNTYLIIQRGRLRYRWIEMAEDFDVKQRTGNIYERWGSENNKKLSDRHSKEDGDSIIE
jgi:hypothetical protein